MKTIELSASALLSLISLTFVWSYLSFDLHAQRMMVLPNRPPPPGDNLIDPYGLLKSGRAAADLFASKEDDECREAKQFIRENSQIFSARAVAEMSCGYAKLFASNLGWKSREERLKEHQKRLEEEQKEYLEERARNIEDKVDKDIPIGQSYIDASNDPAQLRQYAASANKIAAQYDVEVERAETAKRGNPSGASGMAGSGTVPRWRACGIAIGRSRIPRSPRPGGLKGKRLRTGLCFPAMGIHRPIRLKAPPVISPCRVRRETSATLSPGPSTWPAIL